MCKSEFKSMVFGMVQSRPKSKCIFSKLAFLWLTILLYILFILILLYVSGRRMFYISVNNNEGNIINIRIVNKLSLQRETNDFCNITNSNEKETYKIIYHNGNTGRLGNLMFSFASIQGIAEANNRNSAFNKRFDILTGFFPNLRPVLKTVDEKSCKQADLNMVTLFEFGPWSFEEERFMRNLPNESVSICCYLNSWKYFAGMEKKIRKQFQFHNDLLKKADNFLLTVLESIARISNQTNITFVGVHIRMGDIFLDKKMIDAGFRVAPLYYIHTAMDYYRQKYNEVHFIVCTDNLEWTRKNLATLSRDVHLASKGINDVDDMVLLSRCNHSIMTQGTFGWWASFLAGGDVVYYHPPVKPTLGLFNRSYVRANVYPPNWICYTDDPHGEKLSYVRPCTPTDQI